MSVSDWDSMHSAVRSVAALLLVAVPFASCAPPGESDGGASVPADAAGVIPDSGAPPDDAGLTRRDAGRVADAAVQTDAGNPAADAGSTASDAGTMAGTDGSMGGDTIPPTLTAWLVPVPDPGAWMGTVPQITFTCSDGESGIPVGTCPAPVILTPAAGLASFPGFMAVVHDAAGNPTTVAATVTNVADMVAMLRDMFGLTYLQTAYVLQQFMVAPDAAVADLVRAYDAMDLGDVGEALSLWKPALNHVAAATIMASLVAPPPDGRNATPEDVLYHFYRFGMDPDHAGYVQWLTVMRDVLGWDWRRSWEYWSGRFGGPSATLSFIYAASVVYPAFGPLDVFELEWTPGTDVDWLVIVLHSLQDDYAWGADMSVLVEPFSQAYPELTCARRFSIFNGLGVPRAALALLLQSATNGCGTREYVEIFGSDVIARYRDAIGRFAPHVRLHPQEAFLPESVDHFLERSHMVFCPSGDCGARGYPEVPATVSNGQHTCGVAETNGQRYTCTYDLTDTPGVGVKESARRILDDIYAEYPRVGALANVICPGIGQAPFVPPFALWTHMHSLGLDPLGAVLALVAQDSKRPDRECLDDSGCASGSRCLCKDDDTTTCDAASPRVCRGFTLDDANGMFVNWPDPMDNQMRASLLSALYQPRPNGLSATPDKVMAQFPSGSYVFPRVAPAPQLPGLTFVRSSDGVQQGPAFLEWDGCTRTLRWSDGAYQQGTGGVQYDPVPLQIFQSGIYHTLAQDMTNEIDAEWKINLEKMPHCSAGVVTASPAITWEFHNVDFHAGWWRNLWFQADGAQLDALIDAARVNCDLSNHLWYQDKPALRQEVLDGDLTGAKTYVHLNHFKDQGVTDIQYWMFYGFNGPGTVDLNASICPVDPTQLDALGTHYSDWEVVHVRVNDQTLERVQPCTGGATTGCGDVTYFLSGHGDHEAMPHDVTMSSGEHALLYSSKNGHAFKETAADNADVKMCMSMDVRINIDLDCTFADKCDSLCSPGPCHFWEVWCLAAVAGCEVGKAACRGGSAMTGAACDALNTADPNIPPTPYFRVSSLNATAAGPNTVDTSGNVEVVAIDGVVLNADMAIEQDGVPVDADWISFPGSFAPPDTALLTKADLYGLLGWSEQCADSLTVGPCKDTVGIIPGGDQLCEVALHGRLYDALDGIVDDGKLRSITKAAFGGKITTARPGPPTEHSKHAAWLTYQDWSFKETDGAPLEVGTDPCTSNADCAAISVSKTGQAGNYTCQNVRLAADPESWRMACVENTCIVKQINVRAGN